MYSHSNQLPIFQVAWPRGQKKEHNTELLIHSGIAGNGSFLSFLQTIFWPMYIIPYAFSLTFSQTKPRNVYYSFPQNIFQPVGADHLLSTRQIFKPASERILGFPPKSSNHAYRSAQENRQYLYIKGTFQNYLADFFPFRGGGNPPFC